MITPAAVNLCIPGPPSSATVNVSTTPTMSESWSSNNLSTASVTYTPGSGMCAIHTNSALGVAIVTYNDGTGNTCDVPVYVGPYAGAITGPTAFCISSTINLSSNWPSGTWSTAATTCSVNSVGVVTGLSAGTGVITYSVSACGGANSYHVVTVDPVYSPSITGKIASLCGGSISLSATPPGGIWTSSIPSVASVNMSGVVTAGAANGITVIQYTKTNSCGSFDDHFTLQHGPYAGTITGPTYLCTGAPAAITLSDAVPGGSWSCVNVNTMVSALGVVTGINAGTEIITYTVPYCGGMDAYHTVTVDQTPTTPTMTIGTTPIPGGIPMMCVGGATITYTGTPSTGGYAWSSDAGVAAVSSGVVTAVSTGTSIISYGITTGCGAFYATETMTVNATASAGTISGTQLLCMAGPTTSALSTTGDPGVWSINGDATINSSGLVTAVSTGFATITYDVGNACGSDQATYTVTIGGNLSIGGSAAVCAGSQITLPGITPGGTWTTNTYPSVATVTGDLVSGLTAGTTTLSYSVTTGCGTFSDGVVVTVDAMPNAGTAISSTSLLWETLIFLTPYWKAPNGSAGTIETNGDPGGYWTSTFPSCVTFSSSGGGSSGPTTGSLFGVNGGGGGGDCQGQIYYEVTNACGTDRYYTFGGTSW